MSPFKSLLALSLLAFTAPVLRADGAVTMKDLAIAEARVFDKDHNNKIDSTEAFALREEFKKNANSHLYMFDENSNHYLDDAEGAKLPLGPPPAAAAAPKHAPAAPSAPHAPHPKGPAHHPELHPHG